MTEVERKDDEYHQTGTDEDEENEMKGETAVDQVTDSDGNVIEIEEEATWHDVYVTCCVHTRIEWFWGCVNFTIILFFLWCFLITLDLMGTSSQVMTGCIAGALFGDNTNPVAGLMIGIICTALVQSSSTTTSIIVSLTGSAISVEQGIYMIMGANIGTTITNTIVAMGQMGDGDQLERAFAGACINDMYNYLSVLILLPLEVVSGYLAWVSYAMCKDFSGGEGESFNSPLDALIDPIVDRIILPNRGLIVAVADETGSCALNDGFYPIICNGPPSRANCPQVGLIRCSSQFGCPFFFNVNATVGDDKASGSVMFILSIGGLFVCMGFMASQISKMLLGTSTKIIRKATSFNGYIAIVVGLGITVLVQSSSITTSVLTPLVGLDVITLESMYPLTLGANIGTTITAIMAALVQSNRDSLQVALAHLIFNLTGICIWYPIPFMRAIPLRLARYAGKATRFWKGFPLAYIAVAFFIAPIALLGLSTLFTMGSTGLTVLGSVILIVLAYYTLSTWYKCKYKNGWENTVKYFEKRQSRADFMAALQTTVGDLQDDVGGLKTNMTSVLTHNGLPDLSHADEEDEAAQLLRSNEEPEEAHAVNVSTKKSVIHSVLNSIRSV